MNILYVEDNQTDIDLLKIELNKKDNGIKVTTAERISLAKQLLSSEEKYDAVLIDMKLPDGNGLDLLSYINDQNISSAVIILTGYGDQDSAIFAIKFGADDYLPKSRGYYSKVLPAIETAIERKKVCNRINEPIKLVYVEHNQDDVEITLKHLSRYAPHLKITNFPDAEKAIEEIKVRADAPNLFDVILMDYKMPKTNAIEMLKIFKQDLKIDIPVVIITGHGNEEIAAQAMKLGAADYIVKNDGYLFKLPIMIQNAYSQYKLQQQKTELVKVNTELKKYFDTALDMLSIHDEEGNFIRVNKQWQEDLGYSQEEMLGRKVMDLVHEDDIEITQAALSEMMDTNKILDLMTRYKGKDGKYRWLEWRSYKLDDKVYSVARDVTGRKEYEEELFNANSYMSSLIEQSSVPKIVWDSEKQITHYNDAFAEISGYSLEEISENNLGILFSGKDKMKFDNILKKAYTGENIKNIEMTIKQKNGAARCMLWNSSNVIGKNDNIIATIVQCIDITERKTMEEKYRYQSIHDQLTGLYNRVYYIDYIKKIDVKENLPLSIIFADVNGLKLANDAFGYQTGDRILMETSKILKDSFRPQDTVIRMGGDEFIIVMPSTEMRLAEKYKEDIKQKNDEKQIENLQLSISFGIETKNDPHEKLSDIIKKAENNMHRMKLFEDPSIRSKTIFAIINTLHEKNNREEQHSKRVSKICGLIGKKLNFNDNDLHEITTVGLLHDIGKIAVPEQILNKKGKLTEDEWRAIKRHPEIGYRILSAVNDMADLAECVLYHHERMDGSGYPRGLKNEEIPLFSRIIAVADTYDAMTSSRPYREALSHETAMAEIKRNAGTMFDSKIVELFIEIPAGSLTN